MLSYYDSVKRNLDGALAVAQRFGCPPYLQHAISGYKSRLGELTGPIQYAFDDGPGMADAVPVGSFYVERDGATNFFQSYEEAAKSLAGESR